MENLDKVIVGETFGIVEKDSLKVVSHVLQESEIEEEKTNLMVGKYICVKWHHFLDGSDEMVILENTYFEVI